jgi:hypothetical protein
MNGYKLVTNISMLFYFKFRRKTPLFSRGKKAGKSACRPAFHRFERAAEVPVERFRKLEYEK